MNDKKKQLKACFGAILVICLIGAVCSLVALVVTSSPIATLSLGVYCLLFWAVAHIGNKIVNSP